MTPISDVLVAFAVSRLTDGERPVDVSAALDRALAGARWHNALLKKARTALSNLRTETSDA